MTAKYLAVVDPGKNTGVCFVAPELGSLTWSLWSGPPMRAVRFVEEWIKYRGPAAIVAERFTITSIKHTRQYDALEVIGALRYISMQQEAEFELQSRADRMRVHRDVALRFARPMDDDQESALKHALVAAVRHNLVNPVNFVVRSELPNLSIRREGIQYPVKE